MNERAAIDPRVARSPESPARAGHGFGTYLHYVKGYLDGETARQRRALRPRLMELQDRDPSGVYVEVMVSPSIRSVLAQALQVPGVSGLENNTVLLELRRDDRPEVADAVVENALFASTVGKSLVVFRHSEAGFGKRRNVHLWLTWDDEPHATLMVMLAYVLLGRRDWRHAKIHVFAALPSDRVETAHARFLEMIADGRLPISPKNIHFLPFNSRDEFHGVVEDRSSGADLVIRAARVGALQEAGAEVLRRHPTLPAVLFVTSADGVTLS